MCLGRFVRLLKLEMRYVRVNDCKMTKKTIKEILESYMRSDSPEEVRAAFDRWLTDRDSCDEKEDALSALWESMPLTSASVPENPFAVIEDAEKMEELRVSRTKNIWLWMTSAVAACMTVFALIGWNARSAHECTCCLVSSSNSKGEFTLPDGSVVWLNQDSRLYYSNDLKGKIREVKLEGEGYFNVAKDAEHPFVVQAGDMVIKVLGTRFTVSAYNDRPIQAYLEEGSILATVPEHEPVTLTPDHAVRYDSGSKGFVTYKENASDHTAWVGSRLEFVNKPLSDIIECLEHWYCEDIFCSDMETASGIRLSMTIRQESIDEIFSAISTIADLSYITDSSGNIKISFN